MRKMRKGQINKTTGFFFSLTTLNIHFNFPETLFILLTYNTRSQVNPEDEGQELNFPLKNSLWVPE